MKKRLQTVFLMKFGIRLGAFTKAIWKEKLRIS